MGKAALVETDIKEGKALLSGLDDANLGITAALWFYFSDSNEWRLLLATRQVDDEGPKKVYERVQSQLETLKGKITQLSLQDISIVSPTDKLVTLLKPVINTGPGISGIRFTRNVIKNLVIEDAYIYRMS